MHDLSTNQKWMLLVFFAFLVWSAIRPHDYFTWALEVAPAVVGLALIAYLYRRFPFTEMTYFLMLLHSIILIIGGHYTYAEMPLFNWIRDALGHHRNSYDGVGHFAQGFFPAIYAREVLLRRTRLERGGWLALIVVSLCLAFSALYELIEWWVSILTGSKGDSFLGTQGDIWDTQKDMGLCLLGSIVALITLSRRHDRALGALAAKQTEVRI